MQVQFLNPDFPSSPSFSFHPSTCDFSYSFNTHLLRTYGVPVTAETEGPPSPVGVGGQTQTQIPVQPAWLCPLRGQDPTVSEIGAPQTSYVTQCFLLQNGSDTCSNYYHHHYCQHHHHPHLL